MPFVPTADPPSVHVITLGCARNEVDSEELAARLVAGGYGLAAEPADADAILVNTCAFVDAAKKDSIDTVLSAADLKGTEGASAAWPNVTVRNWRTRCPKPTRFWDSTHTPTLPAECGASSAVSDRRLTCRGTVGRCYL
jgi:hypothetical protein